jgi:hypothetical protein
MRCCARVRACAAVLLLAAATARAQPSSTPVRLLDVPYIQQSEALCGGAAAAMVMRYWGATGVYAETFAALVDRAAGGIRGEDLLRDLGDRGWSATSFRGDAPLVQARLRAGQPVIALIEDRPGTYHYVVVVAWANGRVVHHDPARAPFRVSPETVFEKAWAASGHWTLLALPPPSLARPAPAGSAGDTAVATSACRPLVEQGVREATSGRHDAALHTLAAAADGCPDDPAPWREMAGAHALKGAWKDAASHAEEALRRDGADEHSWRILATSRFLTDDPLAALDAWNAVGEPVIDIVNVRGLEHTRHAAASGAMRLAPQTVLTRAALLAAAKRLADVPAAQVARVSYRPLENGRAAVDAVLIERPRSPFGVAPLAMTGLRAATMRELTTAVANPTGSGDLLGASWRWWENRPRVALAYAAPVSFGGVIRLDVQRDEQAYGAAPVREVRKGGNVSISDWTMSGLRWETGVGVDAWNGRGRTLGVSGALDRRLAADRVSIRGQGTYAVGSFDAWTAAASLDWRSNVRNAGPTLHARAGIDAASADAPLAFWPGADTGYARPALLRAHPLLDDGVVRGEVFGRRLYSAGVEWRHWLRPVKGTVRFAPAAFVDAARAGRRLVPGDAWHVDAGVGLRLAVPGSQVVRIDVATGLRDGNTALSIAISR